jgi:hypothetical protein
MLFATKIVPQAATVKQRLSGTNVLFARGRWSGKS